MTEQIKSDQWNAMYERVIKLTERRNVYFGVWDTSAKVAWACRKCLKEYEGKTNRDEAFVRQLELTMLAAEAKVNQLDPEIARIDAEIDQRLAWLQNKEGIA